MKLSAANMVLLTYVNRQLINQLPVINKNSTEFNYFNNKCQTHAIHLFTFSAS